MMEAFLILIVSLLATSPWWIPAYKEQRFNKYFDKNYSVYDFKCPSCSAKANELDVLNFDNCCHGFGIYVIDGKTKARSYAGSKVVCRRCGQIMHIVYFIDDLEDNTYFALREFLQKNPTKN